MNWNAAKSACEAMGSRLAMLKTHSEQQAVSSKVKKHVWIGFHRNPKDSSQWLWVDGSRVTETNWMSGEPNNAGGNEGCGDMNFYPGKWNDFPCSASVLYLCEANGEGSIQKCEKNDAIGHFPFYVCILFKLSFR